MMESALEVVGFANGSQVLFARKYEMELETLENDARLNCDADGETHTVKIFGREYPLRCSGERDELIKTAEYVETVMRRVADASSLSAHSDIAVLAALNIASELLGSSNDQGANSDEFEKRTQTILMRLEKSLPKMESA